MIEPLRWVRAGAGDYEVEFSAFVQREWPRLSRSAYLMCGDWHRAEDLLQTVLIRLYAHWPRVAERGDPVAYVRRGLLNALLDERRKPWRRERPTESSAAFQSEPPAALDSDEAARLRDALAAVPPKQRAVIVLRYLEGMSVAEVAAHLGISEGTVKSQASRALATLRTELKRED